MKISGVSRLSPARQPTFAGEMQYAQLQLTLAGCEAFEHHAVIAAPTEVNTEALTGFLVGCWRQHDGAGKGFVAGPSPAILDFDKPCGHGSAVD